MVTKRQQLKWMSKAHKEWPFILDYICMCNELVGNVSYVAGAHRITKQEWQQERDKMQKQMINIASGSVTLGGDAKDNSWHERGELPPVGCECVFCNSDDEWVDWVRSVFVGYDCMGNGVVSVFGDGKGLLWISNKPSDFHPLRTERDKACDEMVSVILDYDGYMITNATAELVARQLYDAGYHK